MFAAARAIIILVIVLVVAGGLWYVSNLQANLAVSEENSKKLMESLELQQQAIEQIKEEQAAIAKINNELNDTVKAQKKDMESLSNRFTTSANGESRNFGELAAEKPAAVQKSINRGTKSALRCIEIASGAELRESERNGTEINKECPNLISAK